MEDTEGKASSLNRRLGNIGTIGHVDHGKTTLSAAIATVLATQKKSTVMLVGNDNDYPIVPPTSISSDWEWELPIAQFTPSISKQKKKRAGGNNRKGHKRKKARNGRGGKR